jgi:RND family efflux transporter MFP subunit
MSALVLRNLDLLAVLLIVLAATQNNRRKESMKKLIYTLLLVAIFALTGCGEKAPEVRPVGQEVSCTVTAVTTSELPKVVTATASVEPEVRVTVSTRMMGWVKELHVTEGDIVAKGDALVTIDDSDMKAKQAQVEAGISEATAMVKNAQKMADRFESLFAEKSVSRAQYDDVLTGLERAKAGLNKAKAARQEIQVHLSYLEIKAPSSGTITRRMVDVGDMANPGHPLFYIDQIDRMKIVARLGEKDVNSVKAGDSVTAEISSLETSYEIEVARIIPTSNPGSRTYDVEMYIENNGTVLPGMFAKVAFPIGSRNCVVIPEDAVVVRGQLRGVFIVDANGLAQLRWVRLGDKHNNNIEVISGLSGNETIVLSSAKTLAEGDKVVK